MPRITLGQRLEALANNPHLDGRSRSFAADLLKSYNRNKSLTSGRRVWVDRLEQRAAAAAAPATHEVPADVAALRDKVKAIDASSWAAGFMDSICRQLGQGRALSEKQQYRLEQIREEQSDDWPAEYADKYRDGAVVLADYYKSSGMPYWQSMVTSILTKPDYVPSKRSFMKMWNNTYAKKVLEQAASEPLFAAGDTVTLRSNSATRATYKAVLGIDAFVLSVKGVTSAARGGKAYLVLFPGELKPRLIEERWLKKSR